MIMKKILYIILCSIALFSCNKGADEAMTASSVLISQTKLDLQVGQTATLTATVLPESLGMGVEWSVLDQEYAEVVDGVVTAKAQGVTYVVATSADGAQKAACMVSVNPPSKYQLYIRNANGELLDGIYTYPGTSMDLSVESSDGKSHEYTWSLDDSAVGTVTQEGELTLIASASTDPTYLYDAQSHLKVVTEDGVGVKIPVRSSLLNGVLLDDTFKGAGSAITVLASQAYPISVLYQGAAAPQAIPEDELTLELSNTTDFSIQNENSGLTLVTGASTGVETTLSFVVPGTDEKVQIAEFMIEEVCEMEASLVTKSSSTLIFTWTSGVSADDDIAKAYTVTLYNNSACTEVDQSFEIPAACGAWKGKQPKYVFGGLTPNTTYWFRAVTPQGERSNKVKVTTDAFTHVLMPETITGTGVVLAEDFGEIRWEFDHLTTAVGFRPADKSDFASTAVKTSENNDGNYIYNGYHYSGGGEIEYKSCGEAIKKSRLNGWLSDTQAYVHPGYIKLGTSTKRGWMVTPEFTIPAGKKAKVKVTVTACRLNNSQAAEWGLIVLSPDLAMAGEQGEHTAYFEWPHSFYTDVTGYYTEVTFDKTSWETKSVEGLVLRARDRIAFGGRRIRTGENSTDLNKTGRAHISDMTVEILELIDE